MADNPGEAASENEAVPARLALDERYIRLVRQRSQFGWTLSGIMLAIYFGFILLVAFRRDILAQPIGGGVTSLGIPIGIGVILAGIVLTAVYVHRANRRFDPVLDLLRKEYGE